MEVPGELTDDMQFWVDILTRYSRNQVVIHDRDAPAAILAVVTLTSDDPSEPSRVLREHQILLHDLNQAAAGSDPGFSRDAVPFNPHWIGVDPDRLRVQRGRRESFAASLRRSRSYLIDIRRALRAAKLPLALAYLPHVESSFVSEALSSAGAAGMWQLMPDTAREYQLRVDEEIDERQDPAKSMKVALAYLKEAHRLLGNWPLAVTAYIYGIQATADAVRALHTRDFATFLAKHNGSSFGFASRNYYAQFLAAAHVAEHHRDFFPELRLAPLLQYVVRKGDTIESIAKRHGVPVDAIRGANRLGQNVRLRSGQRLVIES